MSEGFSYTWDNAKPKGSKVDAASIKLGGQTIDPAASYRVTVNSFLADGGDNFTVLREGTNRLGGGQDLDALQAFLAAQERAGTPVTATPRGRITRVN